MENGDPILATGANYDREGLMKKSFVDLLDILKRMGIVDNGFQGIGDMVERIILTEKKANGDLNKPYDKFLEIRSDTDAKCKLLDDFMEQLHKTFNRTSTGPLSEVLVADRLLKNPSILTEIKARISALEGRETCTIVAGETNGGKSTFLNVILGEEILPTDVLHCTLTITKIKYSETYSIETLDHEGLRETYPCQGTQDAHDMLRVFVAQEDQIARLRGAKYKEITLRMPAPILKSGMILVDTPGIGEMEEMDNVTMNYIRSTRADGFIYIIKSDTAGGVQEDRLVSFLRAVQEDKRNSVESAIDPRAALFISNRWDVISKEGVEIVKKNALTKLDIVWPGFRTEQAHFFSSKQAKLHLDADPEFITDKLNDLLLGINKLFKRVADNNIQNQYRWIKTILPAASRHLGAMINHCISSNEDLEELFRTLAFKQETLMKKSIEKCPDLEDSLIIYKVRLKAKLRDVFSNFDPTQIEDFEELHSIIPENYLQDSTNKEEVDLWIVNSLIRHCDNEMHESGILEEMEDESKSKIEEHIGLFQEQINEITELVKGQTGTVRPKTETTDDRRSRLSAHFSSLDNSKGSTGSSSLFETIEHTTMNPSQLNKAVGSLLRKKKPALLQNIKMKVVKKLPSGTLSRTGAKGMMTIQAYVAKRLGKYAKLMKDNDDIIEGFAVGYLHLIELYIKSAVDHIPHFIDVNNKLMDNIRDHRRLLQDNKESMKTVMDELERHREQLRGYGLLYMEDHNADNVYFNTDREVSIVNIERMGLGFSTRNDSGCFTYCGSNRNRSRGFWTDTMNAVIKMDGEPLDILLKTYCTPIDTNTQLLEIASLRYLDNKSLAPFFGMTRIACTSDDNPEKVSAFIFKGSLVSARIFKDNPLIVFKNFLKNFVHELISGLEYIHRENMVHLELNLDTVMVNFQTGAVQLCQQCKPRVVELPKDLNLATKSAVCLSPPVLHGAEYGITDDIYAFMLLVWELLFPDNPPYAEQRQWTLDEFIDKVSQNQMLGPAIEKLDASETVLRVFRQALLTGRRSHCLTTGDIKRSAHIFAGFDEYSCP